MKTLKTGAAFGLAALTIVSGLSLGTTAATAATPDAPKADDERVIGQLIYPTNNGKGYTAYTGGANSLMSTYKTLGEAEAQAVLLSFPAPGSSGRITSVDEPEGCMIYGWYQLNKSLQIQYTDVASVCSQEKPVGPGSNGNRFSLDEDGGLTLDAGSSTVWTVNKLMNDSALWATDDDSTPLSPVDGAISLHKGLTAMVDKIDKETGTAMLSGAANADANAIMIGDESYRVTEGKWTARVTGLKLGTNTLTVKQFAGKEKISERDIDVNIDVADLADLKAEFGTKIEDKAQLSGTAEPGAEITIKDTDKNVTKATADRTTGEWEAKVAAPGTGKQTFSVTQTVYNMTSTAKTVDLTYGGKINVTSPGDGDDFAGGALTLKGDGADFGDKISVLEKGSQIGSTVEANPLGSWKMDLAGVSAGEHKYTVKQLSKGNLVQEQTVTVNPGEDAGTEFTPLAVTSGHTYTPNVTKKIEGTATKGAKIVATNQWGTKVGEATANDDGTWAFSRQFGPAATYTLTFVQTAADGKTDKVENFQLAPDSAVFEGLKVTSGHTYKANTPFELKGTATPGATVKITNQWGTVVGEAKATDGNKWSYSRAFGPTASYTLKFVQTTIGGQTSTVENFALNPEGVTQPLAVTSDSNNDTYRPGNHTFAGKGTTGSTVTAKNQWGTAMGSATVDDKGNWKFDRNLGPTADYTITFSMSGATGTTTLTLNAPKWTAMTQTSDVSVGYTPGAQFVFKGKATPFSKIELVNKTSSTVMLAGEADKNGDWSIKRGFGPSNVYQLGFTQTAVEGKTDEIARFAFGPVATK